MIVTSTQVMQLFRISREQLRRWREKSCPQITRGRFDLKAVIEWRDKTLLLTDAMSAAKLKREQSRAERESLKARKEAGTLISRQDAIDGWAILVRNCYQGFSNLPRRISETVVLMDDPKDVEAYLRGEIHAILNELSEPLRKGGKREKKRYRCRTEKQVGKVLRSKRRGSKAIEEAAQES